MTDDELIAAMLHPDPAIGFIARQLWDKRHSDDPPPPEPKHCSECFEGCPKCTPRA